MKKWGFLVFCLMLFGCVSASTPLMKRNLCDSSIPGKCYDWKACRKGSAEHCVRLGAFYKMASWYVSYHKAVARQLFQRACSLRNQKHCTKQEKKLPRAAIRYVLYSKWLDFYNCASWWIQSGKGKVFLSFKIVADGSVKEVKLDRLTLNSYNVNVSKYVGLVNCYRKELGQLRFLPPGKKKAIPYMFTIPFRL